jgi:hypothetical protein
MQKKTLIDRFLEKVDKCGDDDCWEWKGALRNGYGRFSVKDSMVSATHMSWKIHRGSIPAGMWLLHNCPRGDNPACCNPAHLWLGTAKQNTADMISKCRQGGALAHGKGEQSPQHKLTDLQVRIIKRSLRLKVSHRALAKFFQVSRGLIGHISAGRNWDHVVA